MLQPLRLYGEGLANRTRERDAIIVRFSDGAVTPLALARYLAPADDTDESVLSGALGPVLDVGCGPGRHLHALARRGVFALGVDLSSIAVALARGRGVHAIVGSIFDGVPGAGTWRTALLLDGNIGIGGSPVRLLQRVGALVSDEGELLVELDPPGTPTGTFKARLELTGGTASEWFDWARVAFDEVDRVTADASLRVLERWRAGERWFARLGKH
jgi:SAM-dependent methyltransferase